MQSIHWSEVKAIYQEGIDTGQATFEETPPDSWESWTKKFLPSLSFVCVDDDQVLAWAAIAQTSSREVYRGVGELSLYVSGGSRGRGIGKKLMARIISESEDEGFWTLQAGIFPENPISIQLHQDFGFRIVGKREKIGKMSFGEWAGRWRDVLLLERRSEYFREQE